MECEKSKKSLGVNAILNVVKQSCNILFPLITYPYISRVLGADNIGKYSFSNSLISYALLISSLGIPTYAIREGAKLRDDQKKITQFASEMFTISLASSLFAYIILVALIVFVDRFQKDIELTVLLSINILTFALGRDWINSIFEDYKYITIRYIFFHTVSLILMLILVRNPDDYVKYTVITVIANSGANLTNILYTERYAKLRITSKINYKKHLRPILYLFCITVAATIYVNSDITVIGFYCTDNDVGVYSIVAKIYSILKSVLNAIIMVTIPRLSFYIGKKETTEYIKLLRVIKSTLLILIAPCVVGLFLMSEEVVDLVGGKGFISGYLSLRILSLSILFAVLGCFYAHAILIANGEEKKFFYATVVSAVVNLLLNIIVIPLIGINGAALTTLFSEIIVMIMCKKSAYKYYSEKDNELIKICVSCLSIVLICLVAKMLIKDNVIRLVLAVVISAIAYFGFMLFQKDALVLATANLVKNKLKNSIRRVN